MRTTLELPDPLFARLKARAVNERISLKQLLRTYVEQGLAASAGVSSEATQRSAAVLPQLEAAPLGIPNHQLSNAGLFELLES